MLYNLRRQRFKNPKNKIFGFNKLNSIAPGGFPEFDPQNITGYIAGYQANRLIDNPPGTLCTQPCSQWFELSGNVNFVLQGGVNRNNEIINGLNCWLNSGAQISNLSAPFIFTNFNDFTICIVFKKSPIASTQFLCSTRNATNTNEFWLLLRNTGFLELKLSSGADSIICTTINEYDDNNVNIVFGRFDQTNKTGNLIVNGIENISQTNLLYNPALITNSFRLATWWFLTLGFTGSFGDVYIFNNLLNDSTINGLGNWLKAKFNGTWSNI